jgi:molybdopterin converting factor small subunit
MSTTTDTSTVTIHIPTPLRAYTDEQATASVPGATVGEALRALVERYPELETNLYTDDGSLRQFVNIYVGDEDIRHLDEEGTSLSDDDELSIVPSIAGG